MVFWKLLLSSIFWSFGLGLYPRNAEGLESGKGGGVPRVASKRPSARSACSFELAALRSGSAPVGESAPTRLVVLPWGTSDGRERGKFICNERTVELFGASQRALKLDRLAIDFEHATVPGTPAYESSQEPRKVAGYGTPKVEPGVGIVLVDIAWTPEGLAAIQGGHFQDLSPATYREKDGSGVVVGLHSVGLVRHGELDGLTVDWSAKTAASLLSGLTALSAAHDDSKAPRSTPSATDKDNSDTKPMKELLLKLLSALGVTVADDADDAAFESAVTAGASKLEALMAKPKEEVEPDAMSAELASIKADLAAMKGDREQARRDALVAEATRDGKVIPLSAEDVNKLPVDILSAMIGKLPAGDVATQRKTPDSSKASETPDALSADETKYARQLGLTDDEVRAAKVKAAD